ncbi:hypothetical protein BC940DRAFT_290515 [Gongronella butleri]|nr:hypothetical protein BC940DRAFT_290515 [Gongronella butleri]
MTSSSSSSSTFYQPSPSSDAHTAGSSAQLRDQQPAQPSNPPPSNQISSQQQSLKEWCDRIRSLVDLFGILWFIVGNYILFTTQNCTFQARPYYYTILTWVLLNYIVILIPVFVCASVVFCLPCVLVVLRMLNVHDVPGMTVGATNEEIENMPVYRYKKEEADATPTENRSTVTLSATHKRQSWFRAFHLRLHRQKRTDVESRAYSSITITPQEDAMCSICLSEYEAGDLICKLWCSHHFHKDCVHEWLGLNPLCPLCKQDFRGKEGQDEETEMETR